MILEKDTRKMQREVFATLNKPIRMVLSIVTLQNRWSSFLILTGKLTLMTEIPLMSMCFD